MNIYTEITPNPATLKFIVDRILIPAGTADFPDAAAAEKGSGLARLLFKYPFTTGVFIGRNFITLTKKEESRWEELIPVIKEEFKNYLLKGEPLVDGMPESTPAPSSDTASPELVQKIKEVLDEQVRPAVAMDGGDIIYEGFEDGVLRLRLQGSCSGCPSSTITLKHGIQNLMLRLFPDVVKEVEAV